MCICPFVNLRTHKNEMGLCGKQVLWGKSKAIGKCTFFQEQASKKTCQKRDFINEKWSFVYKWNSLVRKWRDFESIMLQRKKHIFRPFRHTFFKANVSVLLMLFNIPFCNKNVDVIPQPAQKSKWTFFSAGFNVGENLNRAALYTRNMWPGEVEVTLPRS